MKHARSLAALLALVLLAGCTAQVSQADIIKARETYVSSLHALNVERNAGHIPQKLHDQINPYVQAAHDALDAMQAAYSRGSKDAYTVAKQAFLAALQRWAELQSGINVAAPVTPAGGG